MRGACSHGFAAPYVAPECTPQLGSLSPQPVNPWSPASGAMLVSPVHATRTDGTCEWSVQVRGGGGGYVSHE